MKIEHTGTVTLTHYDVREGVRQWSFLDEAGKQIMSTTINLEKYAGKKVKMVIVLLEEEGG